MPSEEQIHKHVLCDTPGKNPRVLRLLVRSLKFDFRCVMRHKDDLLFVPFSKLPMDE